MDATLKLVNFKRSITKFFRDSLETGEGLVIYFNKWIPSLQESSKVAGSWISINIANINMGRVSTADIVIIIRTESDLEGFDSARIYDKIMKYITSDEGEKRVIEFYNTESNPWEVVGGIQLNLREGETGVEEIDYTHISVINVQAMWGAKL